MRSPRRPGVARFLACANLYFQESLLVSSASFASIARCSSVIARTASPNGFPIDPLWGICLSKCSSYFSHSSKKRGKNSEGAVRCLRNSSLTYLSPRTRISAVSFSRCCRKTRRYNERTRVVIEENDRGRRFYPLCLRALPCFEDRFMAIS
jgi:hypothetical protein